MNNNPDLLRADRLSLFNALCKAAIDGLLPDGREGALVIFNEKIEERGKPDRWIKKVQWMPMVFGIIKKVRQSGEVSGLRARIVYENEVEQDRFSYKVIDGIDHINHEPILFEERGRPVLAYAIAIMKDGMQEIEPMTAGDVAKVRAVSKSGNKNGEPSGIWAKWEDEMWKKTAIRRLCKRLPFSAEVMDAITRDDELIDRRALAAPETQSITRATAIMSADGAGTTSDASALADGELSEAEQDVERKSEGREAAQRGLEALENWWDWLPLDAKERLTDFRKTELDPLVAGED